MCPARVSCAANRTAQRSNDRQPKLPVSEHKQPCGYLWADDMRRLRMVGKLGDDERGGDGDERGGGGDEGGGVKVDVTNDSVASFLGCV